MGAAVFAVNEETNQIRGAPVEHSCTNFGKEYGRRHQPFEIRHGPEVETTAARRFTDWGVLEHIEACRILFAGFQPKSRTTTCTLCPVLSGVPDSHELDQSACCRLRSSPGVRGSCWDVWLVGEQISWRNGLEGV
jgi:hypothetical protein